MLLRDRRVIKSKDNPHSIETMEYVPLDVQQEPPLVLLADKISKVQGQIDKLLSEAKREAADVVQKARLEAVNIKEEASQSGYDAGQEAAVKEMQEAVDSISMAFKSGLEDIASLKDSILSQAEDDIVQLTIAIARKLVCRELKQHPDTIVAIVKEAIKAVRNGKEITVEIHPDDYVTLKQLKSLKPSKSLNDLNDLTPGLTGGFNTPRAVPIRIEENSALTPGGCVVTTDTNLIDMSFEARLESIVSEIVQTVQGNF